MKIQTLSILAGSEACNARCPFCVSKMTPPLGVELQEPEVNWRNFEVACGLAKQSGVTTAMFTGKGEPTLFPNQINKYLDAMAKFEFPLIELQTNGILIAEKPDIFSQHLKYWWTKGMTTIAISIVHYDPEKNRQIYVPYKKSYIDLPKLIDFIHRHGLSVRLTCIACNEFIDSIEELNQLVDFAKANNVEQLTLTPVNKPENSRDQSAYDWTKAHHLTDEQRNAMAEYLKAHGAKLLVLAHGAVVYDLRGQNLCWNHCLSVQPEAEEMRNLIFFPDGHLRYYWQYPGAILL